MSARPLTGFPYGWGLPEWWSLDSLGGCSIFSDRSTKEGATHTGRLPLSVLEQQHRLPGLSGHVVNVLYGILSDGLAVQVDGEVKRAVTHAHFPHCLNESLFHGGDRGDYFGLSGVVAQDSQELTVGRNNGSTR